MREQNKRVNAPPSTPRSPTITHLVRFPWNRCTPASSQEIEIRSLVGLHHMINIQLLISALHSRLRLFPPRAPGGQLFVGDFEMNLPGFHIDLDHVAAAHQRQSGPPTSGLGRHTVITVPIGGAALMRASEMRIMSFIPFCRILGGSPILPTSAIPG